MEQGGIESVAFLGIIFRNWSFIWYFDNIRTSHEL